MDLSRLISKCCDHLRKHCQSSERNDRQCHQFFIHEHSPFVYIEKMGRCKTCSLCSSTVHLSGDLAVLLSFFDLPKRFFLGTVRSRYTISGFPFPSTASLVTVQMPTLESDGISYIISIITFSMMERSPLAPVFLSTAIWAIGMDRLGGKLQLHVVQLKQLLILLDQWHSSVLSGCFTRASSSRRSRDTDHRHTADKLRNQAEFRQDPAACTCFNSSSTFMLLLVGDLGVKADGAGAPAGFSMIFSSPSKAPPQINRILVVSIWDTAPAGDAFFRPEAERWQRFPPGSLSSACCTPSPDTSLVMETFSDFLGDLIDLIDINNAVLSLARCRNPPPGSASAEYSPHPRPRIPPL